MSKYILTKRDPKRIALILALTLALNCLLIYTCSFDSYAEESDTSVSVISHSHRGSNESGGSCYSDPVYHVHDGNAEEGGECYQTPVEHHHGDECYGACQIRVVSVKAEDPSIQFCSRGEHWGYANIGTLTVEVSHSSCGLGNETKKLFNVCYECFRDKEAYAKDQLEKTHDALICQHSDGEITGYQLSCVKDTGAVEYYNRSCGLEEKDYGSVTFTRGDSGWTKGPVFLTGVFSDPEGVISQGGYGVVSYSTEDGNIDSQTQAGISVSSNGTYKMRVSVNEDLFDSASAEVALTVSNIDSTAPKINAVTYDNSSVWVINSRITVDAEDVQPDGTPGAGLDDAAYSFDGGVTWQTDNTYTATTPDTVEIRVRDKCGNIASSQAVIENIDDKGPKLNVYSNPEKWKRGDGPRTYTIAAWDEGCGLNVVPYSYDGGVTWTTSNSLELEEEGTYTILVRDGLGNQTSYVITNEYTQEDTQDDDTTGGSGGGGSGDSGSGGSTSGGESGTGGNTSGGTGGSGSGSGSSGSGTGGSGSGSGSSGSGGSSSGGGSGTGGSGSGSGDSGSGTGGSGSGSGSSGSGTGSTVEDTDKDTDTEKEDDKDKESDDNKDGDKDKDKESEDKKDEETEDKRDEDKDKDKETEDKKDNGSEDNKDGREQDDKTADDKPSKPVKPSKPAGVVVIYDNPVTPVYSSEESSSDGGQSTGGSTSDPGQDASSNGTATVTQTATTDKNDPQSQNGKDTSDGKAAGEDDSMGKSVKTASTGKKKKTKTSAYGTGSTADNDRSLQDDDPSSTRDTGSWVEFGEGTGAYYYPLWNPGTASVDAGIMYADPSLSGLAPQSSGRGESRTEDSSESEEVVMDRTWSDQAAKTLKDAKLEEDVPFYRTKAFKVTASVGGSTLGALIPLGIFLFMYSGVLVFSYDSKKYRFMGIKMVHRSERGRYINMSREFMEKSFSSKYKLYMGRIYTKMHPDELLHISADKDWMSVPVQKHSYITIRNT